VSAWIDWAVKRHMPRYFQMFDIKGNLLSSYELPAPPVIIPPKSWVDFAFENTQSPAFWYGTIGYLKTSAALGIKDQYDRTTPYDTDPVVVGTRILTISLLLALGALFWARLRHFSWGSALAWAGFVFAFNVAGLIAFRLVADWPVQIPCPECKRKRPVEEINCPYCHALWPVSKTTGTEIFDKTPDAQTVA
jgi:hypothetical protein